MSGKYSDKRIKTPVLPIIYAIFFQCVFFHLFGPVVMPDAYAQEQEENTTGESVELNGDTVEYSRDGNTVIAEGNVVIIHKDMELSCDRIEFSRDTNLAYATGNIRLVMTNGEISEMTGEELTFNFKTMEGSFDGARIFANPYFGYGGKVEKVGENHIRMEKN